MNYHRHYDALIQKALIRSKPEGYTEKHHIVPRSLGGSDDSTNLVVLTAREHCVAHLLLAKIHGGSMWQAAYMMINRFSIKSSRIYSLVREQASKNTSIRMKGNSNLLGYSPSEETRAKLRKARIGRTPTLGKFHSEETKNKMSSARKGKVNCNYRGVIYAKNILTGEIKMFNGLKEAVLNGFNDSGISSCITGNQKSHKGFTFYRESDIFG